MNDLNFNRATPDGRFAVAAAHNEAAGGGAENLPILIRLLRIAKRWKWLIVGAIGVGGLLGLVATLLMTPKYTASTTLEIQRENNRLIQVQGVEPDAGTVDLEFYQTQYGLLQARSLAERVATELRLYENQSFFEMYGASETAEEIRAARVASPAQRQERVQDAAELLLRHIAIVPARISRLVEVRFTSPDATLSAQVVNAWTRNFVEMTIGRRFEATSYARRFLEQRLQQTRQRLEESERALVAYASSQRIINIPSTSTSTGAAGNGVTTTERSLVAEDLSAINQELNEAIAARTSAESRLRGGAGGTTVEALQNQAISTLRARRAELAADHARMLSQFEPEYPPAQALANQIRELDRSIGREEARVSGTLQATYRAAATREASLSRRVQSLQRDLIDLRGRSIQYNIYQREVDTNRQLYDALLQRYKEIGAAGGIAVNNISVVDAASVPERPSSPNLIINLILGLMFGSAVGAGLALALDQIDEAISDPSDVERALGLPLLGAIPKAEKDTSEELADRKSSLVEAYLSAQTSLAFTTDHGFPKTLTVTSSRPGEGKTTTSYALARSVARTGRRVILVDADMRSPSLHHIFEVNNEVGLSNYLAGTDNLQAMIKRGLTDDLALLTAGPSPPNAAELLVGDRVQSLIRELSAMFDLVILDVPPVMGLADTPLVASQVEGVIFVIESHATPVSTARVAVKRLQDAQARVLGVLLTKFVSRRAHYGYGYDYGYGYGENAKSDS